MGSGLRGRRVILALAIVGLIALVRPRVVLPSRTTPLPLFMGKWELSSNPLVHILLSLILATVVEGAVYHYAKTTTRPYRYSLVANVASTIGGFLVTLTLLVPAVLLLEPKSQVMSGLLWLLAPTTVCLVIEYYIVASSPVPDAKAPRRVLVPVLLANVLSMVLLWGIIASKASQIA